MNHIHKGMVRMNNLLDEIMDYCNKAEQLHGKYIQLTCGNAYSDLILEEWLRTINEIRSKVDGKR